MSKAKLESNDRDIRAALRVRLTRRHAANESAFVVEELPVARGSSRIDMAVINGRIEGYEIKSSRDTLERLPRQIELYSSALDRVTLVAAPKHIPYAMQIIPDWWGVVSAEIGTRGAVRLGRIKTAKLNLRRCPVACIDLLEKDELVALLSSYGLDKGFRTASWCELADRVVSMVPKNFIFDAVRKQLKIRVSIEARYPDTAFGRTAAGGGVAAALAPFMGAAPAG